MRRRFFRAYGRAKPRWLQSDAVVDVAVALPGWLEHLPGGQRQFEKPSRNAALARAMAPRVGQSRCGAACSSVGVNGQASMRFCCTSCDPETGAGQGSARWAGHEVVGLDRQLGWKGGGATDAEVGMRMHALGSVQPDIGHEVLWVLRDCLTGEVLLAKSLRSATTTDLAALLTEVRMALAVPIVGLVSGGQETIRHAVEKALPGLLRRLWRGSRQQSNRGCQRANAERSRQPVSSWYPGPLKVRIMFTFFVGVCGVSTCGLRAVKLRPTRSVFPWGEYGVCACAAQCNPFRPWPSSLYGYPMALRRGAATQRRSLGGTGGTKLFTDRRRPHHLCFVAVIAVVARNASHCMRCSPFQRRGVGCNDCNEGMPRWVRPKMARSYKPQPSLQRPCNAIGSWGPAGMQGKARGKASSKPFC